VETTMVSLSYTPDVIAHHIIPGPVIVYMAKVDNALTASGTSANWFKVAQAGLLSTDYWVWFG
jgi:hypothetical protein